MAFDEELAAQVRDVLGGRGDITEKRMFSGLAFLLEGTMVCAVTSRGLMLRIGPDAYEGAIVADGVGPFEMRGRPMRGWVLVDPAVLATTDALLEWVDAGVRFARTLPVGGTPRRPRRKA